MKKAFTLVEVVIAIIIFGIGLLAILLVVNKNIVLSKKVLLKTKATFLAKESLENIYNIRDTNFIKYLPWNYITWTIDEIKNNTYTRFKIWEKYITWLDLTWTKINLQKINNLKKARLYKKNISVLNSAWEEIFSWLIYNYFTWEKTPYYRYVFFTGVYLQPEDRIADENQLLKVVSKVNYQYWYLTWKVELESFIWNWKK